jgi:hypothetical protein
MQKAGINWDGCSGGDTQQPLPPPVHLLYIMANEVEQQFLGWQDIVVIRMGTCNHNSLDVNILGKAAVLHFALTPFCSWRPVPIPAYRLSDIAVLMSSFHRLLILHSPQVLLIVSLLMQLGYIYGVRVGTGQRLACSQGHDGRRVILPTGA